MNAIEAGIITENTKSRLTELENDKERLALALYTEKIKEPYLPKIILSIS